MINSIRTATRLMIVARPNQSASWNENLLLLLLLSIPMLAIAIGFALLGAWLILPFAGVELLALAAALYRACRRQQFREVITVSDDSICVDQGYHCPRHHWRFARASAGLSITTEQHTWNPPALRMHDCQASVQLGAFLNREDSLQLIALLRPEIRVRAHCPEVVREF